MMFPAWLVGCTPKPTTCIPAIIHQHVYKILAAAVTISVLLFYSLAIYVSKCLLVHRHYQLLRHSSNCQNENVFCGPSVRQSNSSSVLLGRLATKASESLKHMSNWPDHMACASPLPRDTSQKLFHSRELVIWSADHHPSPACDARNLLEPLGIRFLQHDLSPYCSILSLCSQRRNLKVINADNMFDLDPALIPRFYEAYKNDVVMQSVDAFLCYDPPAICELYEPFNKSLIVIASNRYYITRGSDAKHSDERWKTWNKNLLHYASYPWNFVAANNRYDVEVIRYFTGLAVPLIPSFAGYTQATYNPSRKGFLLAKRRVNAEFNVLFHGQFKEACKALNRSRPVPELIQINDRYPRYSYADLAAHQGIIHLPYQVSTMSIFEHYCMNIPLFFPSKELLLAWSIEHWVVRERTLPWLVRDPRKFNLPPHPSQRHVPSPNDNTNPESIKYWLQFADYYTLPHITYFNSSEHLAVILQHLTVDDLKTISLRMKKFNVKFKQKLLKKWAGILQTVARFSPNNPH